VALLDCGGLLDAAHSREEGYQAHSRVLMNSWLASLAVMMVYIPLIPTTFLYLVGHLELGGL
jgi:hypothetical protein